MARQNRETWQIWRTDSCNHYFNPGQNIVLSDFYIGLAQYRRPYIFRFFFLLAIKTRVLRVKK